jgi:hypothetical protein
LPDCLPILHSGLFSREPGNYKRRPQTKRNEDVSRLPLSTLLSRVLLAFAIEFERDSDSSVAICANVLRVLDEKGVRARDLPVLSGVSKESISMAMGVLQNMQLALTETARASRTKRDFPSPARFRTSPWSCIVAAIPTAANGCKTVRSYPEAMSTTSARNTLFNYATLLTDIRYDLA